MQINDMWRDWLGLASSVFTGKWFSTRRIAVDSQQTSFEENEQFEFFDELDEIPSTSQIVYLVQATNPINITRRTLDLWEGARKYRIYPAIGNITFTGTLTDVSEKIFEVNTNIAPELTEHPVTTVTVQKATGSAIFSTTNNPRKGTAISAVSGQGNVVNSAYNDDSDKAGIGGNSVFWIVMDNINGNEPTNGMFTLKWEEKF